MHRPVKRAHCAKPPSEFQYASLGKLAWRFRAVRTHFGDIAMCCLRRYEGAPACFLGVFQFSWKILSFFNAERVEMKEGATGYFAFHARRTGGVNATGWGGR